MNKNNNISSGVKSSNDTRLKVSSPSNNFLLKVTEGAAAGALAFHSKGKSSHTSVAEVEKRINQSILLAFYM